jgi:hypothetical protein
VGELRKFAYSYSPVSSSGFSLCTFAVRVSQGREGRDGSEGSVGREGRDGRDGSEAAGAVGAALGAGAAGRAYIPGLAPILCPSVGRWSGVGSISSSGLNHGREASQGSGGREGAEGAGGSVGICSHLGRAFGSNLNAI